MNPSSNLVHRYDADQRYAHWIIAICFFLVAVSGLALYHPSLYWLSALLGGGAWTRILHPFIGVATFLAFIYLALRLWKYNRMSAADWKWATSMGAVMTKHGSNLPEPGRYNGGQKLLFKLLVLFMLLLLISGIGIWRPYFAYSLPINAVRLSALVHAIAAFFLIVLVIGHIYMALWTRDSVRAMTRGTVTRAWAKHHHPAWYRQVTGESDS